MQFTTDSNILHLQHKQLKYQLQKANNILNHIPLFRQVNPSKQPGGSLREGAPVKVNPHQIQLLKRETHTHPPLPSPLIITCIPHPHPTPPSYPTPSYNLKTRKQEQRDWTHTKQAVVRTSESRITDTAQLEERKDREWQCRNGEDDFDCDYDFAVRWLIRLGLNLTDMKWKWMPDLMTWYHECVLRNEKI